MTPPVFGMAVIRDEDSLEEKYEFHEDIDNHRLIRQMLDNNEELVGVHRMFAKKLSMRTFVGILVGEASTHVIDDNRFGEMLTMFAEDGCHGNEYCTTDLGEAQPYYDWLLALLESVGNAKMLHWLTKACYVLGKQRPHKT